MVLRSKRHQTKSGRFAKIVFAYVVFCGIASSKHIERYTLWPRKVSLIPQIEISVWGEISDWLICRGRRTISLTSKHQSEIRPQVKVNLWGSQQSHVACLSMCFDVTHILSPILCLYINLMGCNRRRNICWLLITPDDLMRGHWEILNHDHQEQPQLLLSWLN